MRVVVVAARAGGRGGSWSSWLNLKSKSMREGREASTSSFPRAYSSDERDEFNSSQFNREKEMNDLI